MFSQILTKFPVQMASGCCSWSFRPFFKLIFITFNFLRTFSFGQRKILSPENCGGYISLSQRYLILQPYFFLSKVKNLIFLKEILIFFGFLKYTFPYFIVYISLFYIFDVTTYVHNLIFTLNSLTFCLTSFIFSKDGS